VLKPNQWACAVAGVMAATFAQSALAQEASAPKLSLSPVIYADDMTQSDFDRRVDAIKKPFEGFSWGADQRWRNEYFNNAITLDNSTPGHEYQFWRYRTRLWTSYQPTDLGIELNARLIWEGRHYWQPSSQNEWDNGYGLFDRLNIKLKPQDTGLTLTLGRQDIMLGDGWLVMDGTPLDGSTSICFDAVRLTWNVKNIQTVFDAILIDNSAKQDHWLPPIGIDNDSRLLAEQDERGAILYVSNKSIEKLTLEPYLIYKNDHARAANGTNGDIYTLGQRVVYDFDEHWTFRAEGAGQFGHKNGQELAAWGALSRLTYRFNDSMNNQLKLNFEALSGDHPDTAQNEAFDPLWGRWPQWSELYVYTDIPETRVAQTTNLVRLGPGWQFQPFKKLTVSADYNALFAMDTPLEGTKIFGNGDFRGHQIDAKAEYKFNRYLSGHLLGEYFVPGDYYTKSDSAVYLRAELVFTF